MIKEREIWQKVQNKPCMKGRAGQAWFYINEFQLKESMHNINEKIEGKKKRNGTRSTIFNFKSASRVGINL